MTFYVKPISALLTRDTEMFSNMDPYVIVMIGNEKKKTKTHKEGGKKPKWNEVLAFRSNSNYMTVTVYDQDTFSDDVVGSTKIQLNKYINLSTQQTQYFDITYKGKNAGKIQMSIRYQKDGSNSSWGSGNQQNAWSTQNQWKKNPSNNNGWNQTQNNWTNNQPQNQSGWGNPVPATGFGGNNQANNGWGNNQGNDGWGNNQGNNGWGNQGNNNGWGNNQGNDGWGNNQGNDGWGNQGNQGNNGWGNQGNNNGWGNNQGNDGWGNQGNQGNNGWGNQGGSNQGSSQQAMMALGAMLNNQPGKVQGNQNPDVMNILTNALQENMGTNPKQSQPQSQNTSGWEAGGSTGWGPNNNGWGNAGSKNGWNNSGGW